MAFRGRFIRDMIQFAYQQGANRNELFALLGKRAEELDGAVYFDTPIYNKVAQHILASTKDPFFGLHFGEYSSLSASGIVVQIVRNYSGQFE